MTHASIELYLKLSFGVILVGFALMVIWARKILKPLGAKTDKDGVISLRAVSVRSFIHMLPGLMIFFASSLPALYFGNLLQRYDYCLQIIRANPGMTKDSEFLRERLGPIDIDELFERAAADGE
ncbi:MAG: hypothetical protein LBT23_03570 [Synergistaceae bacterium]|jgi:hypothetical protein|nr:hypothetical protein [Synergistaceae bacterium]